MSSRRSWRAPARAATRWACNAWHGWWQPDALARAHVRIRALLTSVPCPLVPFACLAHRCTSRPCRKQRRWAALASRIRAARAACVLCPARIHAHAASTSVLGVSRYTSAPHTHTHAQHSQVCDRRAGRPAATEHYPLDLLDPSTWPSNFGVSGLARACPAATGGPACARTKWRRLSLHPFFRPLLVAAPCAPSRTQTLRACAWAGDPAAGAPHSGGHGGVQRARRAGLAAQRGVRGAVR